MILSNKPFPNSMLWTVGIAITLFCATGIAALAGWLPTSFSQAGRGTVEVAPVAPPVAAKVHTPQAAHAQTQAQAQPVIAPKPMPVKCIDCGVIESTREIAVKGEGSGLGAAGGAVLGGLLGNQVGGGRGKDIATVVGAVGGVVAGNEIEKRAKSTKSYEVTVRLDDGSTRVVSEANPPSWRTGDHVKLVEGSIRAN